MLCKLGIFEVISLSQKASSFIFVLTLSTMDFNYSCVNDIFDAETFSFPAVIFFPCFAFLCLVKPSFDLQILSQFSQGKLFSPDISHTASATSSSIVAGQRNFKIIRENILAGFFVFKIMPTPRQCCSNNFRLPIPRESIQSPLNRRP